ncbi:MAG: PilZ domain-containing protein [Kofleriaceae bacterium]
MSERRRFERLPIQVPVNVSTSVRRDRVGMIRDLSASGVLFHSLSKFAIGERVVVMFKLPSRKGVTSGRVVRAQIDPNLDNMFRFMTAVRFDAPLLDLRLEPEVQLGHGL